MNDKKMVVHIPKSMLKQDLKEIPIETVKTWEDIDTLLKEGLPYHMISTLTSKGYIPCPVIFEDELNTELHIQLDPESINIVLAETEYYTLRHKIAEHILESRQDSYTPPVWYIVNELIVFPSLQRNDIALAQILERANCIFFAPRDITSYQTPTRYETTVHSVEDGIRLRESDRSGAKNQMLWRYNSNCIPDVPFEVYLMRFEQIREDRLKVS